MDLIAAIRDEVAPGLRDLDAIQDEAAGDQEVLLKLIARFVAGLIRDGASSGELREIHADLAAIKNTLKEIAMTQQDDVNAAAAFDTQLDTDLQGLTAKVSTAQAALDSLIASDAPVDTSKLKAIQLVLAGDQPNLDAAVNALAADPNLTPSTPAAPPADGSTTPSA